MVDTLLKHRKRASALSVSQKLGVQAGTYGLLTLHRPSNVDDEQTLSEILDAIDELSKRLTLIFPCHPRTRQRLSTGPHAHLLTKESEGGRVRLMVLDPLGYLEFLSLMADARLVLTDSGGIQEETTVLGVPCLTLRKNTERPVTVEQGTNVLVGNSREAIVAAARESVDGGGVACGSSGTYGMESFRAHRGHSARSSGRSSTVTPLSGMNMRFSS